MAKTGLAADGSLWPIKEKEEGVTKVFRWLSPLVPSPCGQHLNTSFPLKQESGDLSAPISPQTLAHLLLVSIRVCCH